MQIGHPGPASILYVEDDAVLRRVSALTLARSGYIVTPAEDGLQAWEALHSDEFDLLITDNTMPGMTGLELVAKARLEGMALPIILASGAANSLDGPGYDRLHFAARLRKPFAIDTLLDTVKDVLNGASNPQHDGHIFSSPAPADALVKVSAYEHWGLNE
jgi:CheY-like chemotaxis protein